MRAASFTELRKNLAAMIDSVNDDHTPILITRTGNKPPALLMSLEDFASIEEARYLASSPKNAEELRLPIAEFEAGGAKERALNE